MKRAIRLTLSTALSALLLTSCFTGIESTPKITAADVKREKVADTPESTYMTGVKGEPFSEWKAGKRFYVTDSKIHRILGASGSQSGDLGGTDLIYQSAQDVSSITGEPVAELTFLTHDGKNVVYRADGSTTALSQKPSVSIPFTVERTVLDQVASKLKGNHYYVMTRWWYDNTDQSFFGRRFVPVTITDILPGNAFFPVKLQLNDEKGNTFYLFMSINAGTAHRDFASLLALSNPRTRYPAISDENWERIINGKIALDMTRDECRLSLGAPDNIDKRQGIGYLYEIWSYENGIYLMFEDGLLRDFRR